MPSSVKKFAGYVILAASTFAPLSCGLLNPYRHSKSVVHTSDKIGSNPESEKSSKPPVRIAFLKQPTHGITALPFCRYVQIAGYDEDGRVTTAFQQTVKLSLSTAEGALGGATNGEPKEGVVTFEDLSIVKTGVYKIVAKSDNFPPIESDSFTIHARFAGGDGQSANPFQITNIYQLQALTVTFTEYNAAFFKITSDIDASDTSTWFGGSGFRPIGNDTEAFGHTFDGGKKTITSLKISRKDEIHVGLFGATNASSEIHDIVLDEADIAGGDYTGMVIGESISSKVYNIVALGSVSGADNVGGIIGASSGSGGLITALYARVNVSGANDVGGLIGTLYGDGPVKYALTDAEVNASGSRAGGAIGSVDAQNGSMTIQAIITNGYTYAAKGQVGGMFGSAVNGEGRRLFAQGSVQSGSTGGVSFAGGLVGKDNAFSLVNCFADVSVYASGSRVGAMVGEVISSYVNYNAASGSVRGSSVVSAFAGFADSTQFVFNVAVGRVVATSNAAGMIAYAQALPAFRGNFFHNGDLNSALTCVEGQGDSSACAGVDARKHGVFSGVNFSKQSIYQNKISANDASSFDLSGDCAIDSHGSSITVTFTKGVANGEARTKCVAGKWKLTADLHVFADGSITAVATMGGSTSPSLTLVKSTTLCQSSASEASGFASGSGTVGDPYIICTKAQFLAVDTKKSISTTHYFKLGANIDLSPTLYAPLGSIAGSDCTGLFCNIFDGDGFALKNAVMTMVSNNAGAFSDGSSIFGELSFAGTTYGKIQNLKVVGARILGNSYVGALASKERNGFAIEDVVVDAHVIAASSYAGGLAAHIEDSSVEDSLTNTLLVGQDYAGLIAGLVSGAGTPTLSRFSAEGAVVGNSYVGGAIGDLSHLSTTVTASRASAMVLSSNSYVGGFVGHLQGSVQNSYAISHVLAASSDIGGFVGLTNTSANLVNSYAAGGVTGPTNVGGFVGRMYGFLDYNFAVAPYVFADTYNGCFVGDMMNTGDADHFSYAATPYVSSYYGANSGGVDTTLWTVFGRTMTAFDGGTPGDAGAPVPLNQWGAAWVQNPSGLPVLSWE